jgi:DNA-nicking Smr family endonuclease
MSEPPEEIVPIPIDGVLDLHAFSPKDAASVVEEYIRACLEQSIDEVRIIHGKGKGAIRRTVHALLERHPDVLGYRLDSGPSGWGATVVRLNHRAD